jgi:hypothetical protein
MHSLLSSPTITISGDLIRHVRLILDMSLEYALTEHGVRHGHNAYSPHALPAYVLTVSSVESLVNETLLDSSARLIWRDSPLWKLKTDFLEKIDLLTKLVLVPQLLFDKSFTSNKQPLQDFNLLLKVRNDIVHYKLRSEPKYLQPLVERDIALSSAKAEGSADYPWPSKLSCTEGIRWAHNTSCAVVNTLVDFLPQEGRDGLSLSYLAQNFQPIPETYVIEWFKTHEKTSKTKGESDHK